MKAKYLAYGFYEGDVAKVTINGYEVMVEVTAYSDDYFTVQCDGEIIKIYKSDLKESK